MGFFSFSSTPDAGRDGGDGDEARLFAPRDTLIFPPFLPLMLVALVLAPFFCLSFFDCSAFFESDFVPGVGDSVSGATSSAGSSSSKMSVFRSCPLNATLQNGVSASDKRSQRNV